MVLEDFQSRKPAAASLIRVCKGGLFVTLSLTGNNAMTLSVGSHNRDPKLPAPFCSCCAYHHECGMKGREESPKIH